MVAPLGVQRHAVPQAGRQRFRPGAGAQHELPAAQYLPLARPPLLPRPRPLPTLPLPLPLPLPLLLPRPQPLRLPLLLLQPLPHPLLLPLLQRQFDRPIPLLRQPQHPGLPNAPASAHQRTHQAGTHRVRVIDVAGVGVIDGTTDRRAQSRGTGKHLPCRHGQAWHSQAAQPRGLRQRLLLAGRCFPDTKMAVHVQQVAQAGMREQVHGIGARGLLQRHQRRDAARETGRPGSPDKTRQPGQDRQQVRGAQLQRAVGVRQITPGRTNDFRAGQREHLLGGDVPGVAETRALAGLLRIEQQHVAPRVREPQRAGRAHDTGADDDHIRVKTAAHRRASRPPASSGMLGCVSRNSRRHRLLVGRQRGYRRLRGRYRRLRGRHRRLRGCHCRLRGCHCGLRGCHCGLDPQSMDAGSSPA